MLIQEEVSGTLATMQDQFILTPAEHTHTSVGNEQRKLSHDVYERDGSDATGLRRQRLADRVHSEGKMMLVTVNRGGGG